LNSNVVKYYTYKVKKEIADSIKRHKGRKRSLNESFTTFILYSETEVEVEVEVAATPSTT
jgi:hypothetical protein